MYLSIYIITTEYFPFPISYRHINRRITTKIATRPRLFTKFLGKTKYTEGTKTKVLEELEASDTFLSHNEQKV